VVGQTQKGTPFVRDTKKGTADGGRAVSLSLVSQTLKKYQNKREDAKLSKVVHNLMWMVAAAGPEPQDNPFVQKGKGRKRSTRKRRTSRGKGGQNGGNRAVSVRIPGRPFLT